MSTNFENEPSVRVDGDVVTLSEARETRAALMAEFVAWSYAISTVEAEHMLGISAPIDLAKEFSVDHDAIEEAIELGELTCNERPGWVDRGEFSGWLLAREITAAS